MGEEKKPLQLTKQDIDRLAVRVLSRSVWLKKKAGLGRGSTQVDKKKKAPRHKKRAEDLD